MISTTQPDKQVTFDLEGYLGESGDGDSRYKGRTSLGLRDHEVNVLVRAVSSQPLFLHTPDFLMECFWWISDMTSSTGLIVIPPFL